MDEELLQEIGGRGEMEIPLLVVYGLGLLTGYIWGRYYKK